MSGSGKRAKTLAAALGKVAPAGAPEIQPEPQATPAAEPSRRQVQVTMYVWQEDHDRLRDLAHHSRTSLQQLGVEAWNLLLKDRGHAPLAPTTVSKPSGRHRS